MYCQGSIPSVVLIVIVKTTLPLNKITSTHENLEITIINELENSTPIILQLSHLKQKHKRFYLQ